jgi:type IV secretory pathway TrbD component
MGASSPRGVSGSDGVGLGPCPAGWRVRPRARSTAGSVLPPAKPPVFSPSGPVVVRVWVPEPHARFRRDLGRVPAAHPECIRPVESLCGVQLLPVVLPVRRRGAGLMEQAEAISSFYAPVHRALTEPILLGAAPRAVAIMNGTLTCMQRTGIPTSTRSRNVRKALWALEAWSCDVMRGLAPRDPMRPPWSSQRNPEGALPSLQVLEEYLQLCRQKSACRIDGMHEDFRR